MINETMRKAIRNHALNYEQDDPVALLELIGAATEDLYSGSSTMDDYPGFQIACQTIADALHFGVWVSTFDYSCSSDEPRWRDPSDDDDDDDGTDPGEWPEDWTYCDAAVVRRAVVGATLAEYL